jgi:glycosyltransferase involved in cell wall biosynthesis
VTLVSVILPSYDRQACLAAAIDSVFGQTCTDWELIVADDGSADTTRHYLKSVSDPRVQVIWLPHTGNPAKVRNAALQRAQGVYIAFLDSDDLWDPMKLEVQLAALAAAPGCRWCYTAAVDIDAEGKPIEIAGQAPWKPLSGDIVAPLITIEALIVTSAVLVERSLVNEVGGFDESQLFAEDYDLWLRLAGKSDVSVIDRRLTLVRNANIVSYSQDRIGAYEGWVRLYDKLTRSLPDARLRSLAARRRSESALALAGLYANARNSGAVMRTLAQDARRGSRTTADWWWRAAKAMIRASLPAILREHEHRHPDRNQRLPPAQ